MSRPRTLLALAAVAALTLALAGPASAAGRPFTTPLTGAAEPNGGDPVGSGTGSVTVNVGTGEVCWVLEAADIALPALASHIHIAPAGINGPIVVTLSPPDASGMSSGCTTADKALLKSIVKSPESYYINVHTSEHPGGAVRGQLG
jgi:hypothetical protein